MTWASAPLVPPGICAVGLLGGSFNPAHEGHRAISLVALAALGLDRVIWLVSPQNPLKSAGSLADYDSRLARARAVADHPRIAVSDFEAQLNLVYTIDTVMALKQRHTSVRFVYLMGADSFASLAHWRRWTRLMKEIPIAVFARPGFDLKALGSQAAIRYRARRLPARAAHRLALARPPAWVYISYTHHPESATAIRARGDWEVEMRVAPPPQER